MKHQVYDITTEDQAEACAWVFSSPEKFEKIYYKHPVLKENHLRVRILSAGLCHSDLHFCRGKWGKKMYPVCPGHEIVGEVEALGEKVSQFKVGEKVLLGPIRDSCGTCEYCKKGLTNACEVITPQEKYIYDLYWGGYSTHCQHPESHVFKLPDNLDYKTIAPIMCAGITTFVPLFKHCKEGDKVAVLGGGGLGSYAIQFAKKMGCEVHVFSSSHTKDDLFAKLGSSETVIWTSGEHLSKIGQYDVIINTLSCPVPEKELNELVQSIKNYGTWIQVSAPEVGVGKLVFESSMLILKNLTMVGSLAGGVKHYKEMLEFVGKHGIESICEVYPFEEFDKALDKLENGKPHLRCVVDTETFSNKFLKK